MNMTPVEMAFSIMNGMKIALIIPLAGIITAIIKYRKNTRKMMKNILYYVSITFLAIAMIFLVCFIANTALTEIINSISKIA